MLKQCLFFNVSKKFVQQILLYKSDYVNVKVIMLPLYFIYRYII